MRPTAPTAALAALALAAGCTPTTPAPDAAVYEPLDPNPNRIACAGAFRLSGTFTASPPVYDLGPARPDHHGPGCWPAGTWTFSASHDRQREVTDITGDQVGDRCGYYNDTPLPALRDVYSFRVVRREDLELGGWKESYELLSDIGAEQLLNLRVSGDGGGECEADLELRSADGLREWVFKPAIEGTALRGFGDYIEFLP